MKAHLPELGHDESECASIGAARNGGYPGQRIIDVRMFVYARVHIYVYIYTRMFAYTYMYMHAGMRDQNLAGRQRHVADDVSGSI